MKKVLLLLLFLVTASCSQLDAPTTTDCKCGTVIESQTFNVLGSNFFSVVQVKNNCTGIVKQIQKNGVILENTTLCNY
jgi:uncharacterized protein YkvS